MGIRQPDDCRCFGGSCWRRLCPGRHRVASIIRPHEQSRPKTKKFPEILTLSESLAELEKDANERKENQS